MSVDNRTMINDCEATTGWAGTDAVAVITDAGQFYEGSSSLATQYSNTDEQMNTTEDSVNGGTFSLDWSGSTLYMLIKDNLGQTQASGGTRFVVGDGTNLVGYGVGGNDVTGLSLPTFFNAYRLDVSNSAAFSALAYSGSEASLSKTAITQIGYGGNHLAKAVGAIDNAFMDAFRYIANGSAALTINAGTSGTPITLSTVASDDVTNGWGLVSNPQGSQFNIGGPIEWGDSGTGSSYFDQADAQIYMDGVGIATGNLSMALISNATGTNLFKLDNCVLISIGTVSSWDFSTANSNTMEITACQFVDAGTIAFPVAGGTSRLVSGTKFVNCGQVTVSTLTFTGNSFSGTTDANGAILMSASLTDCAFVSDGTGHAIYITATGTYTLTDVFYSGYGATTSTDAVVYNNSGGAVTLNITGGDAPTYRNGAGASTTVNISVAVSFEAVDKDDVAINLCQVSAYLVSDNSVVILQDTNVSGIASTSFSGTTPADIYYRYRKSSPGDTKYEHISGFGTIASGSGLTVKRSMTVDTNNNS